MRVKFRHIRLLGAACAAFFPGFTSFADAITLAPEGTRALLEYTIEVEGKATASNASGEYQHWSTRRSVTVQAPLIAMKATVQDQGEPGGLHRAAKPPANAPFQPSADMKALAEEIQRCGDDIGCRMRVSQKMKYNPQIQADMRKAKQAAESIRDSPPRYQLWITDQKMPATGGARLEVQRDEFFKTAVDERKTCRESGEVPLQKALGPAGWPTTIRIDAQDGTFVANIGGPAFIFLAKIDCVLVEGKRHSEEHTQTGIYLLPEKYLNGPVEIEAFRGGADAATNGRRLAHGEKVLTGVYGTLMGGVPMTAKITVRWTVTVKD